MVQTQVTDILILFHQLFGCQPRYKLQWSWYLQHWILALVSLWFSFFFSGYPVFSLLFYQANESFDSMRARASRSMFLFLLWNPQSGRLFNTLHNQPLYQTPILGMEGNPSNNFHVFSPRDWGIKYNMVRCLAWFENNISPKFKP